MRHFLLKSAARVVQVGLRHGQRAVAVSPPTPPDSEFSLRRLGNQNRAESAKESKPAHKTRGDRLWAKSIPRRDNGFMITVPARSGSSMLVLYFDLILRFAHMMRYSLQTKVRDSLASTSREAERIRVHRMVSAEDTRDPIRFLYKFVLDPTERRQLG